MQARTSDPYAHSDRVLSDQAKVGIFIGSILAGVVGTVVFKTSNSTTDMTAAKLASVHV